MTTTQQQQSDTGSGTLVAERPATDDSDNDIKAHFVQGKNGKTADEIVTEAIFHGFPVKAICGFKWIPCRDPNDKEICSKCRDIFIARHGGIE